MLLQKPFFIESVPSTNSELKKLARKNAKSGFVLVAGTQLGGRGTKKRKWFSPKGGLWFSFLLHNPERAEILPVVASLAASSAIKKAVGKKQAEKIRTKWLNDVLLGNKKIAGVLCETFFEGRECIAIIGIGINTNIERFPGRLGKKATSILIETRKRQDNKKLLAGVLMEFGKIYGWSREKIRRQYSENNAAVGATAVLWGREKYKVKAIKKDFSLTVERNGKERTATYAETKEIRIAKKSG